MDILTQGLLGAALAQSAARSKETRLATGIGLAAGLLADADVLISSGTDPLLTLEYHRHFTHALAFIPVGALIAAVLLWPPLRSRLSFGRLYLFALMGYSLSGFLDACTSYGTHLLWPFSDERVSFHIISIIDPLFTLALLLGVFAAWRTRRPRAARIGLLLAALYLGFGWVQHQRVEGVARERAAQRGHAPERLLVKPTLGNLLLWRSLYVHRGELQVDAIRLGFGAEPRIYSGAAIRLFEAARDLPQLARGSQQSRDIERFVQFSDGWVAVHPHRPDVLADVRYSNLPDSLEPLWGLELNPAQPERHAHYAFYRDMSPETRRHFMTMLLGRGPDAGV